MRTSAKILAGCLVLAGLWGCGGNSATNDANSNSLYRREVNPEAVNRATQTLTQGRAARVPVAANNFGFRLFELLAKAKPNQNVFISPASVTTALAMAYNGSSGDAKAALERVLGLRDLTMTETNAAYRDLRTLLSQPDPKVRIDVANSLWVRQGTPLKREFEGRVQEFYGARAANLDFASETAPKTINAWVTEATGGRIKEMVTEIKDTTAAILLNAVYFKGEWQERFEASATAPREFTKFDGKKVEVPFLSAKGEYERFQADGVTGVRLPYGVGRVAMHLILPDDPTKLGDVMKGLSANKLTGWVDRYRAQPGRVMLPKFTIETSIDLNSALTALGLGVAFDPSKESFANMLDAKGPSYIESVLHKTFVEVNEEGTEAAAATKVEIGVKSAAPMPGREFEFIADRPFLAVIMDKQSGLILFMGLIGDPARPAVVPPEQGKAEQP